MLNRAEDLELPMFLVGTALVTFFFVTQDYSSFCVCSRKIFIGTGLATHMHLCLVSGWPFVIPVRCAMCGDCLSGPSCRWVHRTFLPS